MYFLLVFFSMLFPPKLDPYYPCNFVSFLLHLYPYKHFMMSLNILQSHYFNSGVPLYKFTIQ